MAVAIDRLVRTFRRTVGLRVTRDGRLLVRAPLHLSDAALLRLVEAKEAWIRRTRERLRKQWDETPRHRFQAGETFLLLGASCPLVIVEGERPVLAFDGAFRLTTAGVTKARTLFEAWYRRRALEVFGERIAHWSQAMGARPSRLVLSSARTRWGSCDSRGVVRLAWRLVMAPLPIVDYLVVHELAHLQIRGHNCLFWNLVAAHDPLHRLHRRWLNDVGHTLNV